MTTFYIHYRKHLYSIILRFIKNQQEVEDLLQELFLRALRAKIRTEEATVSWFYVTAKNLCLSRLRMKTRWVTSDIDFAIVTDSKTSPEEVLVEKCTQHAVENAKRQLSAPLRAVVYLRDDGAPFEDIAKHLQIPVGTARNRMHRATKLLKVAMGG